MIDPLDFQLVGEEYKITNAVSEYQPDAPVRELTFEVKKDVQIGSDNLNMPCEELNGFSLLSAANEYQRNWLSWSPGPSNDPEEDWRYTGVRPLTRNRIISTAAHLTQNLNAPAVFAQNDQDETDQMWGEAAGLMLDFNIRRSAYEESYLYGVISGLVNPISYFTVEYVEGQQQVWGGNGKEPELVLERDDEISGFQYGLAPIDEMLFDSLWVFEWQKQRFRARRKLISYEEAQAIFGTHENWEYVMPGVKRILGEDGVFYDAEDPHGNMVELVDYQRRRADQQIPFVNGVYLGNANTEFNPFIHRTNKNKPKYCEVKYGAEPIDAKRFIGYKSLAAKMLNDQELVDTQWQMAMDASRLNAFLPTIITGAGKIDLSVMAPAAVTSIENKDAKITPLSGHFNSAAAFQSVREAERSANESSADPQLDGKSSDGSLPGTARQSLLIQQNAETNLGLMGRMCGIMTREVGSLMMDDIIRYQTVGEVEEILGGVAKMKYRTFIVDNKDHEGSKKTHVLKFTDRFMGVELTDAEKEEEEVRLAEEAGDGREIWELNPAQIAKLDFMITFDYQEMLRRNTPFERSFKLAAYDKAINDPNIMKDPEASLAVTRDFLLAPVVGSGAEKYLPKVDLASLVPQQPDPAAMGGGEEGPNSIPKRFVRSAAMESAGGKI